MPIHFGQYLATGQIPHCPGACGLYETQILGVRKDPGSRDVREIWEPSFVRKKHHEMSLSRLGSAGRAGQPVCLAHYGLHVNGDRVACCSDDHNIDSLLVAQSEIRFQAEPTEH